MTPKLNSRPRYYVSAGHISIIGKPSAALSEKIDKDEKDRLTKRKEELGEEKLKELEQDLEKAKKESDTPPPPEMIKDFPLTDVSKYASESKLELKFDISQRGYHGYLLRLP
jgi:Zn-dependent M16 (insulinase) family peptidase